MACWRVLGMSLPELSKEFILPQEEELSQLLSTREPPLVILARVRKWLHTRYDPQSISSWEIAALMLRMYSLGQQSYDDTLRTTVFCEEQTSEVKDAFITIRSTAVEQHPYQRTDWNSLLQTVVESLGLHCVVVQTREMLTGILLFVCQ